MHQNIASMPCNKAGVTKEQTMSQEDSSLGGRGVSEPLNTNKASVAKCMISLRASVFYQFASPQSMMRYTLSKVGLFSQAYHRFFLKEYNTYMGHIDRENPNLCKVL